MIAKTQAERGLRDARGVRMFGGVVEACCSCSRQSIVGVLSGPFFGLERAF
jgi:hypothetical protein